MSRYAHGKDGILEFVGSRTPGWISNLGISLAAGVVTIEGANGNALLESNLGWICMPSTTAGQFVPLRATANASFNDDAHASSDLTNLEYGLTAAAGNWDQDLPFFLYGVNRGNSAFDGTDGNSAFFLSRSPCMYTTPSAANDIGDTSTIPVNDSQNVIMLFGSYTQANYTSLPCQLLGSLRMQYSSANLDWTVQALDNADGMGLSQVKKQLSKTWNMPVEQNGADPGTFFTDSGGTSGPVFTTQNYEWEIGLDGMVDVTFLNDADGGTDGSGGGPAQMVTPYATSRNWQHPVGAGMVDSVGTGFQEVIFEMNSGASNIVARYATSTFVQNGNFSNGARKWIGKIRFRAFE